MNNSLRDSIKVLENLFDHLNKVYFGSLVRPVITISPNTAKTSAYGWCTTWKAWKEEGTDGYYEINICSEYLNRPFADIAKTMLHEMVHLDNISKGIKDCSRGGTYHNKKYKETAENHGLVCELSEKYGWSKTELSDEAKQVVSDFQKNEDCSSFTIYREEPKKSKSASSRSNSKKYVCPVCGMSVRATKEVKVLCFECNVLLECEEQDED